MGVSWKKAVLSSPRSSRPRATSATRRRSDGSDTRDRSRQADPRGVQVRVLEPGRGRGVFLQVAEGPLARDRRRDLAAQERAGVDAEVPAQVARLLPRTAAPD